MPQPKTKPDWIAFFLLAGMLSMSAWPLAQADWAPCLELLQPTAIVGVLFGVLLARSVFRPLAAHILALGYGAAWIAYASMGYLPRAVGLDTLGEKLIGWGRHIGEWVWLLRQTGVGKDNFIFLLALLIVFWLVGYLAAWNTFRFARVLRVVLPAGLVILVNLYYYGGRAQLSIFLYGYFVFALLYLVRVNLILRERQWQQAQVGFDRDDVRGSFLRGGTVVTAMAIVVAWAAPQLAVVPQAADLWQQLSKPIRSLEDGFNRIFSALESEAPAYANPFGRTLGFCGPRSLGDTVMMDVFVHPTADNAHELARYWRGGTYDVYTANGWRSSQSDSFVFYPNATPLDTPDAQRAPVKQTFTFYFPRSSLLIAAAQPAFFSREAEADARLVTLASAGVSAGRVYVDPSFVFSRDALRAGDTYDAISSLSTADVNLLRAAGTQYPDWIANRYLQLPDDFPQRVKDLAQQIVAEAGSANPFDQISTLEAWLRRNIGYSDKIQGPAAGQDGVEYVLFESHAGYCDYYASALATMARSLGIPARVAVGYARGEYDAETNTYRVREREAHSWVEVYFPNYGWIEFEPTASQPQIARPIAAEGAVAPPRPLPTRTANEADNLDRLNRLEELENEAEIARLNRGLLSDMLPVWLLAAVSVIVLGAVFAAGAIYVVENRGLRDLPGAQWAYARLARLARWLRVDLHAHQTPYEQAALLNAAAPEAGGAIDTIAGDFVREIYARDSSAGDRARLIWRNTHLRLWLVGLKRRILATIRQRRRHAFSGWRWPRRM